jgi:hypothetical protein
MDYVTFQASLEAPAPPTQLSSALQALWYDSQGSWEEAHTLVQDSPSPECAWVHAYLHRKEGDTWNAGYWYQQAGKAFTKTSLDAEWEAIVQALVSHSNES